ncbi:MAG: cytochrome c biogenesis CcdA family protein, partial [Terriglobia bacterium]
MELSFATAFLAGMLSFISPCVLPLAPGYVAMISGLSVEQLRVKEQKAKTAVLGNALLFVLGFSLLFVALGASAGAVGQFLSAHRTILNRIAGTAIVFFGLVMLGWVPIPALYREKRYHGTIKAGALRSFLLGLAFAFGWTPCVGPALTAMLMMASTQETLARGTSLLAVCSAGLAVPFLLVAVGVNRFLSLYQRWRHHLVWVERFAGGLLVAVGVLVFFDLLQELSVYLLWFNQFA